MATKLSLVSVLLLLMFQMNLVKSFNDFFPNSRHARHDHNHEKDDNSSTIAESKDSIILILAIIDIWFFS